MKKTYLLLLAGMFASVVFANNKQTVKIDGNVSDKTVTEITFDGDNVTLNYADNSSETKDMSLVALSFSYDSTTGINKIEEVKKSLQGKVFNLNGQLVGNSLEGLSKGIYIVNGKKVIIK
nr:subtilase [uncultured Prevotella sp.]